MESFSIEIDEDDSVLQVLSIEEANEYISKSKNIQNVEDFYKERFDDGNGTYDTNDESGSNDTSDTSDDASDDTNEDTNEDTNDDTNNGSKGSNNTSSKHISINEFVKNDFEVSQNNTTTKDMDSNNPNESAALIDTTQIVKTASSNDTEQVRHPLSIYIYILLQ